MKTPLKIAILSASVRHGRNSHRVALYFQDYIRRNRLGEVEMLDLKEYAFPLFEERLQYLENPPPEVLTFSRKISEADGILIVTPEYNGGYPASLKNVVDLLYPEWKRKPIAVATVSDGQFGGTQVITSLLFTLWKIGAMVIPSRFTVPNVEDNYDETGKAVNPQVADKIAATFTAEWVWYMQAKKKMDAPDPD